MGEDGKFFAPANEVEWKIYSYKNNFVDQNAIDRMEYELGDKDLYTKEKK